MIFNKEIFKEYATKFGLPEATYDNNAQTNWRGDKLMKWTMPLEHTVNGGYLVLKIIRWRDYRDSRYDWQDEPITVNEFKKYESKDYWTITINPADSNLNCSYHLHIPTIERVACDKDATIDDLHNAVLGYVKRKTQEKKNQKKWKIRSEAAADYTEEIKERFVNRGYRNVRIGKSVSEKVCPWPYIYRINLYNEPGPIQNVSFNLEISRLQDKFNVYYYNSEIDRYDDLHEKDSRHSFFKGSVGMFKSKEDALDAIEDALTYAENIIKLRNDLKRKMDERRIISDDTSKEQ